MRRMGAFLAANRCNVEAALQEGMSIQPSDSELYIDVCKEDDIPADNLRAFWDCYFTLCAFSEDDKFSLSQ